MLLLVCGYAMGAQIKTIPGITCRTPPLQNCRADCDASTLNNQGNAYEPNSGRNFFLDYPCDLKKGENVIFILNLHGAGSNGDWQRHYFPAGDYKEKYRLVVATPTAATVGYIAPIPVGFRVWDPQADDRFLEDIVSFAFTQFGRKNIKSFWLAGHSQGGMTANRLVCTDFFRERVDGWLSLSGGRIGAVVPSRKFDSVRSNSSGISATTFGEATVPTCNLSYIFVSGAQEIVSLPDSSPWAEKYKCRGRTQLNPVADQLAGYVVADASVGPIEKKSAPLPHIAQVFVYPHCKRGKLIADVLRLDRDHGDGLGPNVTEAIVKLIASSPGGKAKTNR